MKSYGIFVKKNQNNESIEDVVLVKEGFNFYVLFFNVLWFLSKKMWVCSAIYMAAIFFVVHIFSLWVAIPIAYLILFFSGFEANNLLMKKFQRDNYYFVGYSSGNDEKEAKLRFLDSLNQENKDKNKVIY